MKKAIIWLVREALALLFPVVLLALRGFAASRTVGLARAGAKPRLVWVGNAILNIKYWSEAMRAAGYVTKTVVYTASTIADKRDFDLYRLEFVSSSRWARWVPRALVHLSEPYAIFIYLLFNFDIFHFFYDGGILAQTRWRFREIQFLHRFGKKVVVLPYGGDVHVLSRMRNPVYKFGQLYHYAESEIARMPQTIRWIDYFSRHADCCVGSAAFDSLYRSDLLPVSYLAIDTSLFRAPADFEYRHDGRSGPVTVVHTPNHRVIKGTEYIMAAVERLRAEGLKVELRLLEKLKNTEVRALVERSDILVELLVSGYGLSGIEGMSLGKPVVSNFQGDTSALKYYSYLDECPVVQANFDTVYEKLKWLVEHPAARREIGERGRRYAEKYHSYISQQIIWEQVYRKIWHGEPVDLMMLFHPLLGRYTQLYNERRALRTEGASAC